MEGGRGGGGGVRGGIIATNITLQNIVRSVYS